MVAAHRNSMRTRVDSKLFTILGFACSLAGLFISLRTPLAQEKPAPRPPTFYRDVLPILQQHCQDCHRTGGIAPMSFEMYEQTRSFAAAISHAAQNRSMPPWFADANVGRFSNDLSLTPEQIATLAAWAAANAPGGNVEDAPPPRQWAQSWSIPKPDVILKMPRPVSLPARGDIEYTYEIVPAHFAEGRWVQIAEVLPAQRQRASCRGLRASAGFEVAASCAGWRSFHTHLR